MIHIYYNTYKTYIYIYIMLDVKLTVKNIAHLSRKQIKGN